MHPMRRFYLPISFFFFNFFGSRCFKFRAQSDTLLKFYTALFLFLYFSITFKLHLIPRFKDSVITHMDLTLLNIRYTEVRTRYLLYGL